MATIKDVAAMAGVSFTTVSHVVNNSRPVSADVRAKVEGAIRELNYVPSAVARSLKARATATIGLVVPNSTNPYFAEHAASRINARRTAIACSSATRTTTR
jgi:LacI family transcriptional regulator